MGNPSPADPEESREAYIPLSLTERTESWERVRALWLECLRRWKASE